MRRLKLFLVTVITACSVLNSPCQSSKPKAMGDRVAVLIEQMLHPRTEQEAFKALEELGCAAVPATIRKMDDRRKLPNSSHISLHNKSPDAFEAMRHYGPVQVVDALAAILNQVTGQDFGFIYNGATDQERTEAIRGWRHYLETTHSRVLCKAG